MHNQADRLRAIIPPLLSWYEANKKSMPWREEPTPYHVWLSEIMLQQTRIEAVIPYYERFLARIPSIDRLAEIDEGELLKLWEGLGYYSRARNLKKAAQIVKQEYGGELPSSFDRLVRLPGIGDYTAGAISSIAFGLAEPAVDGNVLRVLMRICALDYDISLPAVRKAVTHALREVYPQGKRAGALTQALMELGEVVCIPNGAPRCEGCPVRGLCRANAQNETEKYPIKSEKKPRKIGKKTVVVLRFGDSVALFRRPQSGLLANMWEFWAEDGALEEEDVRERFAHLGVSSVSPLPPAKHVFTHIEWEMTGFEVVTQRPLEGATYVSKAEMEQSFAIPTAYQAYKKIAFAIES